MSSAYHLSCLFSVVAAAAAAGSAIGWPQHHVRAAARSLEASAWSASLLATTHSLSSDRATGGGLYDPLVDRTFLAWAGPHMDPTVVEFDHGTSTYPHSPRAVGGGKADDHHNYPKMIQANDGHLVVVWTDHNKALFMSRCSAPRTVDCVWTERKVNDDGGTYPTMHKSSDGTLYVFYRKTTGNPTDYRPLRYVRSADGGLTWSEPVKAIDTSDGMADNLNEVYSDGLRHEPAHDGIPERFLLGWTMAGGGPMQNEHNVYHSGVYFAYFYPGDDTFGSVGGTSLGQTIDLVDMVDHCLVVDSGPLDPANPKAVDYYFAPSFLDGSGHPMMLYRLDGRLTSALWTGSGWQHTVIRDSGGGLFDMEKIGLASFRAFALEGGGVRIHTTVDGGTTWTEGQHILPPAPLAGDDRVRSMGKVIKIENAHPNLELLTLENDWVERNFEGTYGIWTVGSQALPTAPLPPPPTQSPTPELRVLVEDDFDGYVVGEAPGGDWTADEAGGSVTVAQVPSLMDKSVELRDTTASENVGVSHSFLAQTGIVTAVFKVMMPTVSNSFNIALSGSGGTAVSIFARDNQFAYKIGSDYHYLQQMEDGVWYDVKVVADVATQKCDIYIDGVLRGNQVNFRVPTVTDISTFQAATSNANLQVGYIDDAKVYVGTISTAPPSPAPTAVPMSPPSPTPTATSTFLPTRITSPPSPAPMAVPPTQPHMDHGSMHYKPSACNSVLESVPCMPWSGQNYTETSNLEVKIPCGQCVILDAAPGQPMEGSILDLTGGLNVVGRLEIPALADVTIKTPYVFVQGELAVVAPEAGTPVSVAAGSGPQVKFLLMDTPGGVTFAPDAETDNAMMAPKPVGTKAFVVAGGRVDVRAIDPACPGWVKLKSVTYSTEPTGPDPTCETGLRLSNGACCPAACGSCGGTGCGDRPGGGGKCCSGSILSAGNSCDRYSPPCVVSQTELDYQLLLVDDDFNIYTTGDAPGGGWTIDEDGGTVQIANIPSSTDKSVKLSDTMTSDNVAVTHSFPSQTGTITAEFKVMMPTVSSSFNIALSGSGGTAVSIFVRNDEFQYKIGSNYYSLGQSMGDGIWYHIKLIAYVATQKCDIYIDGILRGDQTDFRYSAATDISTLRAATSNANEQVGYIDNAKVYVGTTSPSPHPYDLLEVGEDASQCWSRPGGLVLLTSDTFGYDDHHVAKVADLTGRDVALPRGTIPVYPLAKKKTGVADTPEYPDFAVEVALLERSLVIEGMKESEDDTRIGGHVIFLHTQGVRQHFEGVLLRNMGQEGNLGRYPLHFHMSEDVNESTLAKNVIWESKQRCIVIHGSHNTTIFDNVAYNTKGHCFMTEDGGEYNNTFDRNLGAWTQKLPTLPQSGESDGSQPATFWITNPQNHWTGNVAAGSIGPGFWFELKLRGPSRDLPINQGVNPEYMALESFRDNTAHSNHGTWGAITTYEIGYRAPHGTLFENCKSFKNKNAGIFTHHTTNIEVRGGLLADNANAMRNFAHANSVIDGLDIIGQSNHMKMLKAEGREHLNWCKAGGITFQPNQGRNLGTTVKNCRFSNYNGDCSGYPLSIEKEQVQHGVFNSAPTFMNNTFDVPDKLVSACNAINSAPDNGVLNIAFEDIDGSLSRTGAAGFFVQDDSVITNFLGAYNCTPIMGAKCLLFCPGACLRLAEVVLSPDLTTRGYTLVVTDGMNSGSTPRRDPFWSELESFRTAHIGLALPGGAAKSVAFKDANGINAWPNYADIYLERPPVCGGGLEHNGAGLHGIELVKPGHDDPPGRCADLFSKDDFSTSPPIHGWQHFFSGIDVKKMGELDVVKTTQRKDGGSSNALIRNLDASCFIASGGHTYTLSGKIRMQNSDGYDVASDGSSSASPKLKIEGSPNNLLYKSWRLKTNGDGTWATFEKGFTLPADMSLVHNVKLSLYEAAKNEFLVADWSLTRNPPDPTCEHGITTNSGTVCCAKSCGHCGGSGCNELSGGAESCCSSNILSSGNSCDKYFSPCVLTPTPDPTRSPTTSMPTMTKMPTSAPTKAPTVPDYQLLVDDDFNINTAGDAPGGGWTIFEDGGTVQIANIPSSTDKSVKLSDTTTSDNVGVAHSFPSQTGTVKAEFKVMMPTVSSSFNIALSGSGGTAVSIFVRNYEFQYKIGSNYYPLGQSMGDGIWYDIKLVAYVATQKCDIYIDGILRGNQTDFRYSAATDISTLRAATSNANEQVGYIDDVRVYASCNGSGNACISSSN